MGNAVNKVMGLFSRLEYYKQEDCGFAFLPEDMLIALVEYLDVMDFINLITTCKYFNHELLGPSNLLWAYVCRGLGTLNFVIRSIQFGRRWKVVSVAVDLNKQIDLKDRNAIATFNFREIVEEYYLRVFHKASLRKYIHQFLIQELSYPYMVTVEISEYNILKLYNLFSTAEASSKRFRKDYFFIVDLEIDPVAVHKITNNGLPCNKGGRMIVYKKSWRDPGPRKVKTNVTTAKQ